MKLVVYIQFKGLSAPTRIKASTVEENDDTERLVVKDSNGKKIGEFKVNDVAGWWIEEES